MQTITHWPDMSELSLPGTVAQDLRRRMLEPFKDESSAKCGAPWHIAPPLLTKNSYVSFCADGYDY